MRTSFTLALLILVLAAGVVWRNHHRLAALRSEHETLAGQAASRGIATGSPGPGPAKGSRRETTMAQRRAEARRVAADFMAYVVEMDALELPSYPEDAAIRQRIIKQMDEVLALDAEQWKILIDEIAGADQYPKRRRQALLRLVIDWLIEDHPDQAMVHLIDSPMLLEQLNEIANSLVSNVLLQAMKGWGGQDPTGALAWYQANVNRLPEDVRTHARSRLVRGMALHDPRAALRAAETLGVDPEKAILSVASAAETPEGRTLTLAAIREWSASGQGEHAEKLGEAFRELAFGKGYRPRPFEPTAAWIERSGFSPGELAPMTAGIERYVRLEESGNWIEWLADALPAEVASDRARALMERWVRSDYPAAGDWLAAASEGPARDAATLAYAEAVAPHDPQAVEKWLLTLPEGEARTRALQQHYQRWPRNIPDSEDSP